MLPFEYLLTWLLARHGLASERGASLVEYVLLVSLIALVCLAAMTYFGSESGNSLDSSKDAILGAG